VSSLLAPGLRLAGGVNWREFMIVREIVCLPVMLVVRVGQRMVW